MGCCQSDSAQYSANGADQCRPHGAYEQMEYLEGPCQGKGSCFWVGGLTDYLSQKLGDDDVAVFSTWATFDLFYDFRDDVLMESDVGRRVLEFGDQYGERAVEIMGRDGEVLTESFRLLLMGSLFMRRVLAARFGRRIRGYPDPQLDPEVVERTFALLGRVRELASGELDEPITFAESVLSLVRGLSASQVSELLQRPMPEVSQAAP